MRLMPLVLHMPHIIPSSLRALPYHSSTLNLISVVLRLLAAIPGPSAKLPYDYFEK
jgi:hypothetical protein